MVTRRYFDRTPGYETSVGDVTRIINNYDLGGATSDDVLSGRVSELAVGMESVMDRLSTLGSQTTVVASGDLIVDLSKGHFVHVPGTAAAWSPVFTNVPVEGAEVHLSVLVSGNDHEMTLTDAAWKKGITAPIIGDWDAGDIMAFRFTKLPKVDKWIVEWLYEAVAPVAEPTVTPPTLYAAYTTPSDRATSASLGSATLPAGEVIVWFGPASTDIASMRIFCNHVGALPAAGAEGDSFVGTRNTFPFDLLGRNAANTDVEFWDTNVDPTGNNRSDYDPNGSTTLTVEALLIDGSTTSATFTFNTSNAPVGSDPVITYSGVGYGNATTGTTVTIPAGVDRAVVVQAHYTVNSSANAMTALSLGGTAMTKIDAASHTPGDSQGLGVFTAYMTESNLSTGTLTLTPSYGTSPAGWSGIVYQIWVLANVASTSFVGSTDYDNVGEAVGSSQTPSVTSPANAILLTSSSSQTITTAATVDIGTMQSPVEVTSAPSIESRAATLDDSGVAATETATWTTVGRAVSTLVAVGYAASGGGSGTTPITPGTPSVALTTPADNQIVATWSATTDAVSYEIRWGTTNPPAGAVFAATSPRTITGLAASTTYYVQVRAKSSTDTYSAWSTVQSATPTGTVTPPPVWGDLYLTSTDHRDVQAGEGYGTPNFNDFWTQKGWVRVNASRDSDGTLAGVVNATNINRAIGNYLGRGSQARAFRTAAGPRLFITTHLGVRGVRQNSGASAAEKAATIADMGRSGSTGTNNRDSVWQSIGDSLNATYDAGFKGYEVVHYSISHENFGSWAYDYSGRNPAIVGQPVLTGATNSQYGSEMGAALRYAGATGDCSQVHKLACEHVYDVIKSRCPQAILGMSPNDGEGSSITGLEASALGSTWIRGGFPDRPMAFIAATKYLRGPNKMTFNGGDADDPANWTVNDGLMEYADEIVNDLYGCPFGLLELGGNYAVPSGPYDSQASTGTPRTIATPGDGESQSDQEMYIFYRKIVEEMLPRFDAGLTIIQWWNYLDWIGSNHENGCSFNIFEGMWGWHPKAGTNDQYVSIPAGFVGYLPQSTGKPNWSSVSSNTRYPKTLAWFRSQFAVGV